MIEQEKIATLANEVEARLIDAILSDQGIPHMLISYMDTAWNGLFQSSGGWGHIEAPPAHREEILAILADLREEAASGKSQPEEDESESDEESETDEESDEEPQPDEPT